MTERGCVRIASGSARRLACGLLLGLSPVLAGPSCHRSDRSPAPTPSGNATEQRPAATAPASASTSSQPAPAVQPPVEADDPDRWVIATEFTKGTKGGWVTGRFDARRNKIDVHTHDLTGFDLIVDRLAVNWDRIAVISIDGVNSQLRRRDQARLRFRLQPGGDWVVVED